MYAKQSPIRYSDADELAIVVGLAVDVASGAVLMPLRLSDVARPNMYELPGGKVELRETHEDALKREFREELGVAIEVVGPCLNSVLFRLETDFTVYLYPVELRGAAPQALRSKQLQWLDPKYAIRNVPCVPSTYSFYRDIRKWVYYYTNRDKHGLSWSKWCHWCQLADQDRSFLVSIGCAEEIINMYLRVPKE